jgi:transposase
MQAVKKSCVLSRSGVLLQKRLDICYKVDAVFTSDAWLGHFRRLVVHYERLITTYAGFFHLAYALLTLRRVLK